MARPKAGVVEVQPLQIDLGNGFILQLPPGIVMDDIEMIDIEYKELIGAVMQNNQLLYNRPDEAEKKEK